MEIYGSNLARAGDSRTWQTADFVNNQLPQQLDGVSATVNGKAAYVAYISPTQVNILTTPDAMPGSVAVIVTVNGVASTAFTAPAQAASPAFFVFNGGPYIAAQHADWSLVRPATLYPGLSTPAKPGETVVLWGNGFGTTSVPIAGGAMAQKGSLSPPAAAVQFAGLVSPGEFQFNVVVPPGTPGGDQSITANYNGQSTQAGALLTVQAAAATQAKFTGQELLGRVTNHSVTVNMEADRDLEVYFEYGAASGTYTAKTATTRFPGGTPFAVVMDQLQPNTRYYYRMQYREPGAGAFTPRAEHSFQTQRPRGATFTFDVEFDPHMDENSDASTYALTMANELLDKPDFLITLGDTFMSDKLQPPTPQSVLDRVHLLRSYYDILCHSAPLFLSLGNHEGEWGSNLNGTSQNVAVWDTMTRKQYIPNPAPDSFFSGDTTIDPLVGQRQSYFSWEWGDALFVVLDPYWNLPAAPEQKGDWSLTLGRAQYNWLKTTLENSTATYKFVFAHNLIGGVNPNGLGPMRGGIEVAKYLEWGGYNLDGTWGFDQARPGWPMPIHQLLVANHVNAFFHGHDHLYAKQDLDGIVYQEGPQPSARNTNLGTRAMDYGYAHGTVIGGTGYLRVQVSPAGVKVEYVETWVSASQTATQKNGMVVDSYTIETRAQP